MNANNFNSILSFVAIRTMEKLAYIFPVAEENCIFEADSFLSSRVLFSGPFSGSLILRMTRTLVLELTANMLGIEEEEISLEQQYDAIREAVNVICGNFLPEIAGKQEIFYINSPEIISEGDIENILNNKAKEYDARAILSIDNAGIELCLIVDGRDHND